jgi:hypothetical protein
MASPKAEIVRRALIDFSQRRKPWTDELDDAVQEIISDDENLEDLAHSLVVAGF